MDPLLFDLIISRIDRLEHKVDRLLEFKWKAVGISIAVGVIGAATYELVLLFVQRGI